MTRRIGLGLAFVLAAACGSDGDGDQVSGDEAPAGENRSDGADAERSDDGDATANAADSEADDDSGDAKGDDGSEPETAGAAGSGSMRGGDGMDGEDAAAQTEAAMDPTTPLSMIPESCRGFEVEGLEHSPGGDVLPNTCAPFDPLYNNPYAVRCVDADPSYDTGFSGDDYCILPPAPEAGTQIRVGPESYDEVPDAFTMEPGDEVTDYYYTNAPNTEAHYFYRVNLRMRPGSHHMINNMLAEDRDDGWSTAGSGFSLARGGDTSRRFPGAQRPDQDRPSGILDVPPENAGLGDRIEPNQQFSFNLHHFNLTDDTVLREVWVNVWYKPKSEVTEEIDGIAIFGNPADLNIAPGEHRELHYQCTVDEPTRIITLNGHRHAWTDRFGVWLERGDESIPLYESFDYQDMPTYSYDSISENPVPSVENRIDGGYSGILELEQGDEIHFVCDITNGGDQMLRFANEVLTGEMCILFGSRAGPSLCGLATRVE